MMDLTDRLPQCGNRHLLGLDQIWTPGRDHAKTDIGAEVRESQVMGEACVIWPGNWVLILFTTEYTFFGEQISLAYIDIFAVYDFNIQSDAPVATESSTKSDQSVTYAETWQLVWRERGIIPILFILFSRFRPHFEKIGSFQLMWVSIIFQHFKTLAMN